jgi:hypothetical protein
MSCDKLVIRGARGKGSRRTKVKAWLMQSR